MLIEDLFNILLCSSSILTVNFIAIDMLYNGKYINKVMPNLVFIFGVSAVLSGVIFCGLMITASDETLESDLILSNDTLRAISSSNSATTYMNGGLFVINGYSEDKPVYKYYYLTENLSYKQASIPVEKTDIVIHNSPVSYVIHYGDRVETIYFGGLLHDPEKIRYDNDHYTIYIPENGLSDEIYID